MVSSTVELLEMVLAKTSKRIAAYYEKLLVPEDLQGVSKDVWDELERTIEGIQKITTRNDLLSNEENSQSRLAINSRVPLVDPINILQVRAEMRFLHCFFFEGGGVYLFCALCLERFAQSRQGPGRGKAERAFPGATRGAPLAESTAGTLIEARGL